MIEFHPLANLFPLIEGTDFEDLALDIADHGLHESIWLLDGKILDGRNRYLAAIEAGVLDRSDSAWRDDGRLRHSFLEFDPDENGDPLAFVISKNLHRRQLDESQRATVAAKIANMRQGERTDLAEPSANLPKVAQADAARMLNVSERSLRTAKTVIEKGVPELQQAVERGEIAVSAAALVASQPEEVQRRMVEVDSPAFHAEVKRIRDAKQAQKKARRETRERELGTRQEALPDKKYGLILCDVEVEFETYSKETGMDRSAANHYPVSDLLTLMRRNVASIAAPDCILLFWIPVPHLVEAICIADAWGFMRLDRDVETGFLMPDKRQSKYVSHWAWLKSRIITGYWNRGKHELLLIFTRGHPVAPEMGDAKLASWVEDMAVEAPHGVHSAKPAVFAEWIEKLWPNTPKIELNRRGPARPGWDAWGNEAEAAPYIEESAPYEAPAVCPVELAGGEVSVPLTEADIEQDVDIDLPAWLNRANWVDGHPPARAAAAIMSIEEGAAHG